MLVLLLVLVLASARLMQTHFDHGKLDAYRLELEFVAWVSDLLAELDALAQKRRLAEVTDQLDRASLSALLNTAEGNGRRQRRTRAKFFDDARGSATECAACLDALVAKRACSAERITAGKALLVRVVCILSKLVQMFDETEGFREEPVEYRIAGASV
ncbi:MAG: four helix bundle protein [Limisphaerales bacterium]